MKHRGITLVELVIALAVVAILLNLAVSTWASAGAGGALERGPIGPVRDARARPDHGRGLGRGRRAVPVRGRRALRGHGRVAVRLGGVRRSQRRRTPFDAGDSVLFRQDAAGDGVRIVTSSGRKYLEFHANGGNAGSNATFTFCDGRGPGRATAIAMGNLGTYREVKAARPRRSPGPAGRGDRDLAARTA